MVSRRHLLKLSALGTASFAAPLAYSASNITMTHNTGNPIGSTSPKDLSDNARNLDYLSLGPNPSYPDRKGVPRKSWSGMEGEHNADQVRRESEFDQGQAVRSEQFVRFMESSGYSSVGDYGPGLRIERYSQYVMRDGQPYRLSSLAAVPYTTTGDWATESDAFILLGDDVLRQELADPSKAGRGIAFSQPYANATQRDTQSKLSEKLSIFDLVPVAEHAAIKSGVSTYNASADIAKAISWGVGELDLGDLKNIIVMNDTVVITKGIKISGEATIKVPPSLRAFVFDPGYVCQVPIVSIGAITNYPAFGGNAVTPLFVGDASGFGRGDVVMVSSEDVYGFSTSARKAELMRVLEVSGATIYLHGFLKDTYTANKLLTKLKKDQLIIDGPKFTSQVDPYAESVGGANGVIRCVGAVRPIVNATFENLGSTAVNFTSCWHPMADVKVMDLRDKLAINAFGYGVIAYGATRYGRFRIEAERVRHAYTGGVINAFKSIFDYGTARNNTIFDSLSLNATSASFDTHPGEFDAEFRDCRSVFRNGDSDATTSQAPGYQDRGCDTRYFNCGVEGVGVGWEFLGAQQLHGKENITELHGCWTKTGDRLAAPAVFTVRTKVAPENCYVRVFEGSFNGGVQGGILSIEDGAPIFEMRDAKFYDILTMRMGANNNVSMTGCCRINRAPGVEPIALGDGTTLTIDNYFADAPSYSGNQLVRSGLAANPGVATVNAGRMSATNRSTATHPIGTNAVTGGTASVVINRIDVYPQRSRTSNSASRPILAAADIGYVYFDTTFNKPVFWNGVAWVDSSGTLV